MKIAPLKIGSPLVAIAFVLMGACSQEPATTPDAGMVEPVGEDTSGPGGGPAPTFYSYDGWIGRWIGVEGMYVDISPAGDGNYRLEMPSDLDTNGTYVGVPNADGISFEREGSQFTLDAAIGAETGLKYLDGKQDCLMVAPGEGYCRD